MTASEADDEGVEQEARRRDLDQTKVNDAVIVFMELHKDREDIDLEDKVGSWQEITPKHITSRHTTSYHIPSHHVTPHHITVGGLHVLH